MQTVYFKKLHQDAEVPEFKTENSVGADIKTIENGTIPAGKTKIFKTGLAVELPNNLEMQIRSRSGLAANNSVRVENAPGTIDPDYTGEIMVILHNDSDVDYQVTRGDRIAQCVINEVPVVKFKLKKDIKSTERGTGGLGHTGK